MPEPFFRRSLIATLTGLATAMVWPTSHAQAQFFFGFGAPQQIQTSRGAIQLAPGWHVTTTPVRTSHGYRLAVRSETGEQRQMLIGANGSLSYSRAPEPRPMRPDTPVLRPVERAARTPEKKQPAVKLANVPPRMKQQITPITPAAPKAEKAAPPSAPPLTQVRASPPKDTKPAMPDTPSAPQAPGFAHGVPINPLD